MHSFTIFFFLFFTVFHLQTTTVAVLAFWQQFVGVRGQLLCGNQSLPNTKVKLWNKNKIGTDDQLAAVKTTANGTYELSGGIGSLFGMKVQLKIYHDCNDGIKPCQRKVSLGIPNKFVTRSNAVEKWFNAGILNMETIFPGEERSCIN